MTRRFVFAHLLDEGRGDADGIHIRGLAVMQDGPAVLIIVVIVVVVEVERQKT